MVCLRVGLEHPQQHSTEAGMDAEGVGGLFLHECVMDNTVVIENVACHSGATGILSTMWKSHVMAFGGFPQLG